MRRYSSTEIANFLSYFILIGGFTIAFVWLLTYSREKAESLAMVDVQQEISGSQFAILKTDLGYVTIDLAVSQAPMSVYSFVRLSEQGFYDESLFNRVIKNFFVQGGKPASSEVTVPTSSVERAFKQTYRERKEGALLRGDVALVNSGPDKKSYQFIIITADEAPQLAGQYPVVGRVVQGMDVVDRIDELHRRMGSSTPVTLEKIMIR